MSSKNNPYKVVREVYESAALEAEFKRNQIGDFRAIWELDAPWFEAPNERRDGVSGVVTYELSAEHGAAIPIFIKRQSNHNTRTWVHPIRGIPTFRREFQNIVHLRELGVKTLDVLYFGEAIAEEGHLAVLISRALVDYTPLDSWFRQSSNLIDSERVKRLLTSLVKAIKPMHRRRIRHGCLYGKHIFVKEDANDQNGHFDVRLLDLEKAHRTRSVSYAAQKDLSQLIRHTEGLTAEQAEYLGKCYFGANGVRSFEMLQKAIEKKSTNLQGSRV